MLQLVDSFDLYLYGVLFGPLNESNWTIRNLRLSFCSVSVPNCKYGTSKKATADLCECTVEAVGQTSQFRFTIRSSSCFTARDAQEVLQVPVAYGSSKREPSLITLRRIPHRNERPIHFFLRQAAFLLVVCTRTVLAYTYCRERHSH
jgi:hypothetical protein